MNPEGQILPDIRVNIKEAREHLCRAQLLMGNGEAIPIFISGPAGKFYARVEEVIAELESILREHKAIEPSITQ